MTPWSSPAPCRRSPTGVSMSPPSSPAPWASTACPRPSPTWPTPRPTPRSSSSPESTPHVLVPLAEGADGVRSERGGGDGAGGRRPAQAEERRQLAEVGAGAHAAEELLAAVRETADDLHLAVLDDIDEVAVVALLEDDLPRSVGERLGRSLLAAGHGRHLDDPVGEGRQAFVVCRHHHDPTRPGQAPEQAQHAFDLDVVKVRGGLV